MGKDEEQLPRDLRSTAELLRTHRHEPSDTELDQLKLRARKQASRATGGIIFNGKGTLMRRKILSVALVSGVMLSSVGIGLAQTGNFPGTGGGDGASASADRSASAAQYGGTGRCKTLRSDNRRQEQAFKRDNRRQERGIRNPRTRRAVRRQNRRAEQRQRANNRAAERQCRRTGSPTGSP